LVPAGIISARRGLGLLIDAFDGGLMIGPSHEDGGIVYVHEFRGSWGMAEMEGYEFLINPWASTRYEEELLRINDEQWSLGAGGPFTPFDVHIEVPKLDVRVADSWFGDKWLCMIEFRQFIVNRYSTAKYLHRLVEINRYSLGQRP